jgi:hypothetical protein
MTQEEMDAYIYLKDALKRFPIGQEDNNLKKSIKVLLRSFEKKNDVVGFAVSVEPSPNVPPGEVWFVHEGVRVGIIKNIGD